MMEELTLSLAWGYIHFWGCMGEEPVLGVTCVLMGVPSLLCNRNLNPQALPRHSRTLLSQMNSNAAAGCSVTQGGSLADPPARRDP